jgi:hypothetical protein
MQLVRSTAAEAKSQNLKPQISNNTCNAVQPRDEVTVAVAGLQGVRAVVVAVEAAEATAANISNGIAAAPSTHKAGILDCAPLAQLLRRHVRHTLRRALELEHAHLAHASERSDTVRVLL